MSAGKSLPGHCLGTPVVGRDLADERPVTAHLEHMPAKARPLPLVMAKIDHIVEADVTCLDLVAHDARHGKRGRDDQGLVPVRSS